jgi:tRNA-2-methylthio-N6-dimethylallyladenosine synthase
LFHGLINIEVKNMFPTYYIWTIGCQMNKSESERLASYLENMGYESTSKAEVADLILLNSCVVRQSAETRVINKLKSLNAIKKSRPGVLIGLTGCIVGTDREKLKESFPYIDYIFPAGEFPEWIGSPKPEQLISSSLHTTAYIPIMQGCNNFCSYCIVPYRRGRERSRPIADIVNEVRLLLSRGVKEVTLLGQNVNSYGLTLSEQPDLAELLSQLNAIEELWRIRFLTNHPKDMKIKLIDSIASLEKVCEQINLPVQAGDNDILAAMRRGYTVEYYRQLIGEIRLRVPGISLSTDIIVGFPGETAQQFQNTLDLLEEIRFDMVHVAAYSPRQGTLAAREMLDSISHEVKKERLEQIENLQARIVGEINSRMLDQTIEILVEKREKGKWFGRTRGDKLVFITGQGDYLSRLVNVRIKHTSPWSLSGNVIE